MKGKHNGSFNMETLAHKGKIVHTTINTPQKYLKNSSFNSVILLMMDLDYNAKFRWVPTLVILQKTFLNTKCCSMS